jgi:hypothetical protein
VNNEPTRTNSVASGVAVLVIRGLLLWLVVPLAVICWLPLRFALRRRGATFGRYLGWVDLNLVACLERSVLKPIMRNPAKWVPVAEMPRVTHRVRLLDPL